MAEDIKPTTKFLDYNGLVTLWGKIKSGDEAAMSAINDLKETLGKTSEEIIENLEKEIKSLQNSVLNIAVNTAEIEKEVDRSTKKDIEHSDAITELKAILTGFGEEGNETVLDALTVKANKTDVTKEIKDAVDKIVIPSVDGLASEEWVKEQGYLTEHQDLTDYAKTSEVNSKIENAIDSLNIEDYAKSDDVETKLETLKSDILGDDLTETFDTLKAVQDWADKHGTEYAELVKTVDAKADKSYVDEELGKKADKSELDKLATKEEIADMATNANVVTKINDAIDALNIDDYAKSDDVAKEISDAISAIDLTVYETTVHAEATYATKEALATKVTAIAGKGLSTNDYTTEDKDKLDSIEAISNDELELIFATN